MLFGGLEQLVVLALFVYCVLFVFKQLLESLVAKDIRGCIQMLLVLLSSLLKLLDVIDVDLGLLLVEVDPLLCLFLQSLLDLCLLVLLECKWIRGLQKLLVLLQLHEVTVHVGLQIRCPNQVSGVEFLKVQSSQELVILIQRG